jgi:hypothetical protein
MSTPITPTAISAAIIQTFTPLLILPEACAADVACAVGVVEAVSPLEPPPDEGVLLGPRVIVGVSSSEVSSLGVLRMGVGVVLGAVRDDKLAATDCEYDSNVASAEAVPTALIYHVVEKYSRLYDSMVIS